MSSTKGKKHANVRGITLEVGNKPDLYHLVTSDEQTINAWCDGINSLIGNFIFFFSFTFHPLNFIRYCCFLFGCRCVVFLDNMITLVLKLDFTISLSGKS